MNNTDDNKNMIYFLLASMVLLFGYQYFVMGPQQKKAEAARAVAVAAASSSSVAAVAAGLPVGSTGTLTREQALAQSPRVPVDTPSLKGSIALKGALVDDLYLAKYHETVDPKSAMVELLRPALGEHAYYIQSGFNGQNLPNMPTADTLWTLASGTVLSPGKPVVLTYDNGAGLRFQRTLSIDNDYMITEDDQVVNASGQPAVIAPYSMVVRHDMPVGAGKSAYVHEGSMATSSKSMTPASLSDYHTQSYSYKDLAKSKDAKALDKQPSVGGWFGITDMYWMAAVIPNQKQAVDFTTKASLIDNKPVFQAGYVDHALSLAPGAVWKGQSRIFAGAKLHENLDAYQKAGIPRFGWAIDWGHLSFITMPFYLLLAWLYKMLGNFGLAILALTVIVKTVFYPLAHKSYEQMTKMKHVQQHLQPKLDAIKKRYPDDQQKQQEATMALYQEEKVNPMAGLGGCLPMLLQIPVFICLVKVLQMAIELRHAPFFGWITDLSAPDPLTIINLFGLLPFNPATVPMIGGILSGPLHIGPMAILYGISMWASQQMTPMVGVDPMQKKMMAFMPLMMVFFFSQLAIGLMVYYLWNNILTMLQQYSIMRRLKVENPVDDLIAKLTGKTDDKKKAA